jgi:hypothetical protein
MGARVFLLSPASCSGNRARQLLNPGSRLALARQLRSPEGARIGDVFTFISQLYFRGKLAYARAFARVRPFAGGAADPGGGVLVITTSRGLVPWQTPVTESVLREFTSVELCAENAAYRGPLEEGARRVAERIGEDGEVVLLGSIATDKYVGVLTDVLGSRLCFPREFVGRGDMSRGGLLLQCVREGRELEYVPVAGACRHGVRPPRLSAGQPASRRRRPD